MAWRSAQRCWTLRGSEGALGSMATLCTVPASPCLSTHRSTGALSSYQTALINEWATVSLTLTLTLTQVGRVVDACGAYMVLVALLGLVVCSPRTLSTLGFLAIGLGCVLKPLPMSPVRAASVSRSISRCLLAVSLPRRERRRTPM